MIKFAGGQATTTGAVSAIIDTFDTSAGSFQLPTQLSVARSFLAAVSVPLMDVIVFAGGSNRTHAVATIDLWNASSNAITQPTELPTARHALCGAAAGSRVFFGGGWDNTGSLSSVVEILDLTTMTWSTAAVALSGGGRASLACSSFTINGAPM